jgi:Leucine-rich repeat (LRR) protein
MTFTFTGNEVTFSATAPNIVVAWGDGATNEYTDADYSTISHTYQNSASHTVRIQTEDLSYFSCNEQQLTTLDVSGCSKLTDLYCYNNQLAALDVSRNTELITLACYRNQLTALDVSSNTKLTDLYCYNNQLTALDVSRNTELTDLRCSNNQLTALDVSRNTKLTWLDCYGNQLTATALNDLFTSLPTVQAGEIDIRNNPGAATCDRSIATAKGWSFVD